MKKLYLFLSALFTVSTSNSQIKVVDDSFKTDVEAISELNKPIDMEEFEKMYSKYIPTQPTIIHESRRYGSQPCATNPVGEKFYVYEESAKQYVRINPSDSTACIASMPVGYYEFIGTIFTSDQLDECRKDVLQYKIDPEKKQLIIDRMSFRKKRNGEEEVSDDFYTRASADNLKRYIAGLPNNWNPAPRIDINSKGAFYSVAQFPIYICKDYIGQIYYIRGINGGCVEDYSYKFNSISPYSYYGTKIEPLPYIMLSFYEDVQKMIGQKIAIVSKWQTHLDYITDYISQEPIKLNIGYMDDCFQFRYSRPYIKLNDRIMLYTCKDVVLKGKTILAIIEYEQGNFAIPILSSDIADNWQRHDGFKCRVYHCSEELRIIPNIDNMLNEYNSQKDEELRLAQMEAAQREKLAMQNEAKLKQQRLEKLTAKYGAETAALIAEGRVAIGMTQEMCREAWGHPNDTRNTTTANMKTSVWLYGYKTYLYFDNGKLSLIQN